MRVNQLRLVQPVDCLSQRVAVGTSRGRINPCLGEGFAIANGDVLLPAVTDQPVLHLWLRPVFMAPIVVPMMMHIGIETVAFLSVV